jgi:hypothetical protein
VKSGKLREYSLAIRQTSFDIQKIYIVLVLVGALTSAVSVHAAKDEAWQTGKLLDMGRQETEDLVFENYEIDAGTMVYSSRELLRWRRSKEANLTVNGPVRFNVDKRKLYILDSDDKRHETEIMKKTMKTNPQ